MPLPAANRASVQAPPAYHHLKGSVCAARRDYSVEKCVQSVTVHIIHILIHRFVPHIPRILGSFPLLSTEIRNVIHIARNEIPGFSGCKTCARAKKHLPCPADSPKIFHFLSAGFAAPAFAWLHENGGAAAKADPAKTPMAFFRARSSTAALLFFTPRPVPDDGQPQRATRLLIEQKGE